MTIDDILILNKNINTNVLDFYSDTTNNLIQIIYSSLQYLTSEFVTFNDTNNYNFIIVIASIIKIEEYLRRIQE